MDGRWTEERANAKALWQEGAWHIKELKDNVAGEQGVRAESGEMSPEVREMKARSHLASRHGPSLGFALILEDRHFPSVT